MRCGNDEEMMSGKKSQRELLSAILRLLQLANEGSCITPVGTGHSQPASEKFGAPHLETKAPRSPNVSCPSHGSVVKGDLACMLHVRLISTQHKHTIVDWIGDVAHEAAHFAGLRWLDLKVTSIC